MPITREPSQRALNWVRWNSSKSSVSSLKSNSPTEIIHLGGSRVGTPTEPERPTTAWAFNGPPPAPPSIGIAKTATEPFTEISQTPTELYAPGHAPDHNERPITQWYNTEWQPPAGEKASNGSQDRALLAVSPGLNPPPLKIAAPKHAPVAPRTSSPSPLSPLPSAVFSSSSYSSSNLSAPPRRRSPVPLPYTASSLSHSTTSEETSDESSEAPKEAPPSPVIPKDENALSVPTDPLSNLRRTQSHADIQKRSQFKALPPRPLRDRRDEEAYNKEYGRQHVSQLIRSNTSPSGVLRIFPPQANAPPKSPLPAISEKTGAWGGPADRPGGRPRPAALRERRKERSPPRQVTRPSSPPPPPPPPHPHQGQQIQQHQHQHHQQLPLQQAPQKPPKLTPRERLWLHRNYRGEATFLRAWGLQIANEEDREEGLTILRELIASEAEEDEREERQRQQQLIQQQQQQQQQQHMRSASYSSGLLPTLGPAPPSPMAKDSVGLGLGVIAEERNSREFRAPPTRENLGYAPAGMGANAQEVWRRGGGGSGGDGGHHHHHHHHQRLMIPIDTFNARRVDKHARSESDSSVLGAYLDIRMSRLDD